MPSLKLELEQLINRSIEARLFPACAVGVIKPGQKFTVAAGSLSYDDPAPVKDDSVFDVASLTKAIPTTCLALKLIEEGRLALDDQISKYIGQFKHPATIWNLLTQTIYYEFGFPLSALASKSADEILDVIFSAPIQTSTTQNHYTNSSSIILGLIVEKVYGQKLDEIAEGIFFGPLGMDRTGFDAAKLANPGEIVPTEENNGSLTRGIVHDESTRAFAGRAVGSAGLFSTAPDLLKFMAMLLNGGESEGRSYFKPGTIELMGTNQLEGGAATGLGWEFNQPRYMGRYAEDCFGKTGFTGCLFLCAPQRKSGVVILSNHVHPKRRDSFEPINQFRRDVADWVMGSV